MNMISKTIINIDAIMPYITWFGVFTVIGIALFLLHNLGGLKLFSNHDNKLTGQFLDKFPLVSPEFMKKNAKLQNAENNQEIHELNQRLDHLEQYVKTVNDKVEKQLDMILRELEKRG